jgi:hypothetical protein
MLAAKRHALERGACVGPRSVPARRGNAVRIPGDERLQAPLPCYAVCHAHPMRWSSVGMIGAADICHS